MDDDFEGNVVNIGGKLSTLICNEENCIPYDVDLAIDIPVGEKTEKISAKTSFVDQAIKKWPVKPPSDANFSATVVGGKVNLEISHPSLSDLDQDHFLLFFPRVNLSAIC